MKTYLKRIVCMAISAVLILLLAACAPAIKGDVSDLPFDFEYTKYLGKVTDGNLDKFIAEAGGADDWNTNYVPQRLTPVTVDGADYTMYIGRNEFGIYNYYFERTVEFDNIEEKSAAVDKFYNSVADVLGEPLKMYSESQTLANKIGNPVYNGDDTGPGRSYHAFWNIDKNAAGESFADDENLFAQMTVDWNHGSATFSVGYYLENVGADSILHRVIELEQI
jgi:hypothetical protein